MVCCRPTEFRYPRPVVEATLGVKFDRSIILQHQDLRPVIRQHLWRTLKLSFNGMYGRLTYNEIYILRIRVPLELERELIQIPHPQLRLVRSCRQCVSPIPRCRDLIARLWELETLDELD